MNAVGSVAGRKLQKAALDMAADEAQSNAAILSFRDKLCA